MSENVTESFAIDKTVTKANITKFLIASVVGAFLFLVPIPSGGSFTIPVGIVINFVSDLLVVGDFNIAELLVLIFVVSSTLLSVVGYVFKPAFIMNNAILKRYSLVQPLYFWSKIVGCIIVIMVYFKVGPEQVTSGATGGSMMGVSTTLVSVVIVIACLMPLLTDFGIMEFVGIFMRSVVRPLFTCPGRSAIDLMTSWFGASSAAVILTKGQYESGFYSGREAGVITTNFSLVSIPFCFIIAKMVGVDSHFTIWYIIICITGFALAMITPRIWPLSKLPDTYDEVAGKQINENIPENVSKMEWALNIAGRRARATSFQDVLKSGLDVYLNLFIDLIPLVMAWGTVVLILVEHTQVFQIISMPLGYYLQILGFEDPMNIAPITLVGFADMYIPALMLQEVASFKTRFVLGALSLIQIIYMTEVGIIIVKSRIPVNTWKLFVIFMERTIISIPIVLLLMNIFVKV